MVKIKLFSSTSLDARFEDKINQFLEEEVKEVKEMRTVQIPTFNALDPGPVFRVGLVILYQPLSSEDKGL